ncbi:hypothetical protein [Streptomyces doebereineriae]|uniref:Uncharacterized protein n=1 Tax=Streptomyces doebereineriae TaxID=3075528 RepID=A0ABU2VI20_9ACTN|nr:hypothetical protein [Streptomyces sp. DSM 41640]MDT0485239.1 hypothetical protein [Streptomyces sp. DSM 41640]
MVKHQRKKQRNKRAAERTGASRASVSTGTVHRHPPSDVSILKETRYELGTVELEVAARLVGASRAKCGPCQETLANKVVSRHRLLLAALAGVPYGLPLNEGAAHSSLVSATTRSWVPIARAAAVSGDVTEAAAVVETMEAAHAGELLQDALDHWALAGATPERIADVLKAGGLDGAGHLHTEPDTGLMEGMLPYVPGWETDHDLATRMVGAVWAGCAPCQSRLIPAVVADRATLAGLAGAVFLTPPHDSVWETPAAGSAARAWIEQAHGAFQTSAAGAILRSVGELSEDAAADLLGEALDVWASSGAARAGVGLAGSMEAPPRQRPADSMDALREAGIKVFTLDDLDLGDDVDPYHLAPNYGVTLMQTTTPDGRSMPMLVLYPETEEAGIEDLKRRTDWEHWGLHGMPGMDPSWRLRANIANRSLSGLVHVGSDGEDDIELWRAAQSVSLPAAAWDLFDHVQHVLVAGPVTRPEDPGALQAAGDAGELLAVVARVSFL